MTSRGKATWILVGVIRAHRAASAERFMVSAFLSAYGLVFVSIIAPVGFGAAVISGALTRYCRVDGGATERRCGGTFR